MTENNSHDNQERYAKKHARNAPDISPKGQVQEDYDGTQVKRRTHQSRLKYIADTHLKGTDAKQHYQEQGISIGLSQGYQSWKNSGDD